MILISLGTEVFNPTFKESILTEKHQDNNVFPKSYLSGLLGLNRPHLSKKLHINCTFNKFQT